MILPQCATCQEKVLFESSGMFTIAFHFEFGEGFYKTSCSVAMAIMIFNWNNGIMMITALPRPFLSLHVTGNKHSINGGLRPCTSAGNGWFRGVSDHCSFTLITANCIISTEPSGRPTNVTATPNITSILLTWWELDCSERNSSISHYLVTYDSGRAVNVTQTMLLLDELRPATGYTVSLAAMNVDGEIGPAYIMATRTLTPPTPTPEGNQQV